jgi:hypothetical protein
MHNKELHYLKLGVVSYGDLSVREEERGAGKPRLILTLTIFSSKNKCEFHKIIDTIKIFLNQNLYVILNVKIFLFVQILCPNKNK